MTSCSKAPWGLSVLSRVTRIFTSTTISPGPPSRQRPSRYAFRAGRNLPDKEFRYLRTVIVTAAVYWGLSSELLRHSTLSTKSLYFWLFFLLTIFLHYEIFLIAFLSFGHLLLLYMLLSRLVPIYALLCICLVLYYELLLFSLYSLNSLYICLHFHSLLYRHNTFLSLLIGIVECRMTLPLNLPAPGRRQLLYFVFRLSRNLCFW